MASTTHAYAPRREVRGAGGTKSTERVQPAAEARFAGAGAGTGGSQGGACGRWEGRIEGRRLRAGAAFVPLAPICAIMAAFA